MYSWDTWGSLRGGRLNFLEYDQMDLGPELATCREEIKSNLKVQYT